MPAAVIYDHSVIEGTVLAIDTATERTSVCVLTATGERHVCNSGREPAGRPTHTVDLMPLADRCVTESVGWGHIDHVVVGIGPGLFTGLRIGIMTARALGRATATPVSGITSLAPLAMGRKYPSGESVVTVSDARRDEVFAATFLSRGADMAPIPEVAPMVCSPVDLADRLEGAQGRTTVGSGAVRFAETLGGAGFRVPHDPEDHLIGADALALIARSADDDQLQPPEPIYLRAPDAKRWLERGRSNSATRQS